MPISLRNPTIPWRLGDWRFGDRPADVDAWLKSPDQLHIMVDFRSPETPPDKWHRIMTVTSTWLRRQARQTQLGGVWPALFIVPEGTRGELEADITKELGVSWKLLVMYADVVPFEYEDSDW